MPASSFHSEMISYEDTDFLNSDACRGIRLELEYLKPELRLQEKDIKSTVVIFGGARFVSPEVAAMRLKDAEVAYAAHPRSTACRDALEKAKLQLQQSDFYATAQEFARLVTEYGQSASRRSKEFVVITGGGPGIMEAGNRGAAQAGGISIGLNIKLPFEQHGNSYITRDLSFQFHYFSIRKMHFMKRAKALGCFPGGFGTMDELFEGLTLIQTHIIPPMPIILFKRKFWEKLINWEHFVNMGTISPEDLRLFQYCETAQEGFDIIKSFYSL